MIILFKMIISLSFAFSVAFIGGYVFSFDFIDRLSMELKLFMMLVISGSTVVIVRWIMISPAFLVVLGLQ